METPISADLPRIPADVDRERLDAITRSIIGAAHTVSTKLGQGFLEKVCGDYIPDLIVGNEVVVEVKTVDFLNRAHRLHCINYLRTTDLRICLLLNFGQRRLEVRRLVMRF